MTEEMSTVPTALLIDVVDLLARLSGFAQGTANALGSLKVQAEPLVKGADETAEKLMPFIAQAIAARLVQNRSVQ